MDLIDPLTLARYMVARGFTCAELGAAVDHLVALDGGSSRSRATIGHLRSGKRTGCAVETARAIERCLKVPPGTLFVGRLSGVQQDSEAAA